MEPYREMYCKLFNAVTDAIRQLMCQESAAAVYTLMDAQRAAEELFMDQEQTHLSEHGKKVNRAG